MYNIYNPPPGFCFDILCADEPIIDDKDSPDYNVNSRVRRTCFFLAKVDKVHNYISIHNINATATAIYTYPFFICLCFKDIKNNIISLEFYDTKSHLKNCFQSNFKSLRLLVDQRFSQLHKAAVQVLPHK